MEPKNLYQTADWKTEKHVPVIEINSAEKGKDVSVAVTVGKEIAHPNTTAHHISWIEVYFLPQGEKFPYQIARFEFSCHGASVNGADSSSVFTQPRAVCSFKTEKSGTVVAVSYCNIHGLWQNSSEITIK
ncbi:MAG: class II SORL domain-containing protein [Candidatus Omnitrophica bacterium]|nr:class II SORL domain-containing protein [Candidatus Omnitrophota bacterium]